MNIQPLTPQQVLDNALFGIRKQGYKRSVVGNPKYGQQCRYRDGEGNACGIGHSVPDSIYRLDMERGISELIGHADYLEVKLLFSLCPVYMLVVVQQAHDRYLPGGFEFDEDLPPGAQFEHRMAEIYAQYGCIYTPPSHMGSVTSGESA